MIMPEKPRADTDPYLVGKLVKIESDVEHQNEHIGAIKEDVDQVKSDLKHHCEDHDDMNGSFEEILNAIKSSPASNPVADIADEDTPITFKWLVDKFWMPVTIAIIVTAIELVLH